MGGRHVPDAQDRAGAFVTASGPCVVVGYDGGPASRAAVSWAASALPADGRLVLVHACRPLHRPPSPLESSLDRARHGRALFDELTLEGEDEFLALAAHTELSDRDPVEALLDAAVRHEADAIVVGSSAHGALQNALGTVTTRLLAQSPVPVTVVPSEVHATVA
jgi:nucleotide-binding universal stress UspA family protein